MAEQINKWVKVEKIKDLVVVDFNLDFHHLTPRNRWTEEMVRDVLKENNFNPGQCLQTSKVMNNKPIGEDSPFLKGTFKFINKDYVAPKKSKPRVRENVKQQKAPVQQKPPVQQKTKLKKE
mgnify:CR=1 FL=1